MTVRVACFLVVFGLLPAFAAPAPYNATSMMPDVELEQNFRSPPAGARPWVFWMWLRADTTREAITKDLEEMRAKGIEGAILYDSGVGGQLKAWAKMVLRGKGYEVVNTAEFQGAYIDPIPGDALATWMPHSRELMRFAAKEAGRVGVKLCVTVGLAGTSGPIASEYGQQKLMWSEISVAGPKAVDVVLPGPATGVPPTLGTESLLSPGGHAPPKTRPAITTKTGNTKFGGQEVAVLAVPDKKEFAPADVINLSSKMDASGRLRWQAAAGKWKILRFGYAPTGAKNAWGLYSDAMSAEALDITWNATIGQMIKEMTPEERKGLFAVEDDSWEAGISTWTKRFPAEFQKQHGYDLVQWLPALAGWNVGGTAAAERFRRDYYRTIADLIARNHYAHLRDLAHGNGLLAFSEAAGPNSGQLDGMQNGGNVDVAMGEFWVPSIHRPIPPKRFMLRNAASANHIYGKRTTPCEAFTSIGPFWEESFFDLKNTADQAFSDGCNLIVIHNYSHSPSVIAKPGYAYFAGTLYSRTVTWWEQTPAFNAYLGRCSYLLQQGLFVADALYYRGDAIGQVEQMKTKPALPAEGYDHDNCNLDVLLNRLDVKDGRLVLPDGMSYRVLVIPEGTPMAPEASKKIATIIQAGATVVRDGSPLKTLQKMRIQPDFEYSGLSDAGELDWIHRRAGDVDIYFIASRWDAKEEVACTFRVAGKQPELWDPVTGEIRDALAFRQEDGRTTVPLVFNPRESIFVVFRKPADGSGAAVSNYPVIKPVAEIAGPWEISFDPMSGGPARVTFDKLTDWTKRSEEGIRHYSGTAMYRKKFHLSSRPAGLFLNLGEVREVAVVRVNGVDCGVAWTKPARLDITSAARAGENDLEITVVNLWPNRLIGDESLPREKRFTETNIHKFSAATPLYPSGLLGPVTLETVSLQPTTEAAEELPGTSSGQVARMELWRRAKFGMFIHWGLYSALAGSYEGREIDNNGEWIMDRAMIPVAKYAAYAKDFNPVKFDATEWVRIAKNAGMKYIVITSKHHDGFAMYPSKASPFNIRDATPFKRDPLAELAEACRKENIGFGLYYSQAMDWHHPGGQPPNRGWWDAAQHGDMTNYIETIALPQVKEICSNYGPLVELWWDMPRNMTPGFAQRLLTAVKELQPGVIMNNRLGGDVKGDIDTPEQFIPSTGGPAGRDWETCMTMNNSWGFKKQDTDWKSAEDLLWKLLDICHKGGNFLLNVGPTAEGEIPAACVERLRVVGEWLSKNGESVYGTTASPMPFLSWGRCTRLRRASGGQARKGEGDVLYLHVFEWPINGELRVPMMVKVTGAELLTRPGQSLNHEVRDGAVVVHLPEAQVDRKDLPVTVVKLTIEGEPVVAPPLTRGKPARASFGDAARAFDGSAGRSWEARKGDRSGWLEVDLQTPTQVRAMAFDEPHRGAGKRGQKYRLKVRDGEGWKEVVAGETMGYGATRIFPTVTGQVFCLEIIESKDTAAVGELQLYRPE